MLLDYLSHAGTHTYSDGLSINCISNQVPLSLRLLDCNYLIVHVVNMDSIILLSIFLVHLFIVGIDICTYTCMALCK